MSGAGKDERVSGAEETSFLGGGVCIEEYHGHG